MKNYLEISNFCFSNKKKKISFRITGVLSHFDRCALNSTKKNEKKLENKQKPIKEKTNTKTKRVNELTYTQKTHTQTHSYFNNHKNRQTKHHDKNFFK